MEGLSVRCNGQEKNRTSLRETRRDNDLYSEGSNSLPTPLVIPYRMGEMAVLKPSGRKEFSSNVPLTGLILSRGWTGSKTPSSLEALIGLLVETIGDGEKNRRV